MRVKICGITQAQDALAAEEAGADAIGLIFVEHSKRFVSLEQAKRVTEALGPLMARVGVFVNAPLDDVLDTATSLRLSAVQLHGDEDEAYAANIRKHVSVIKAVSFRPELSTHWLKAFPADAILLDGLKPGSGNAFDWSQASFLKAFPRLILAGGLDVDNVGAGIQALEPYAVDVASGVEARPGVKDKDKIKQFIHRAKGSLTPLISL